VRSERQARRNGLLRRNIQFTIPRAKRESNLIASAHANAAGFLCVPQMPNLFLFSMAYRVRAKYCANADATSGDFTKLLQRNYALFALQ
jgi:hypothetical protein